MESVIEKNESPEQKAGLKKKISYLIKDSGLAFILAAAVVLVIGVLKLVYYYSLMDAGQVLPAATIITAIGCLVLWGIFKRKWIFSLLYLLLSILMIVDVNFYSFFNRSFSIESLSAMGLLGGVKSSINELFMPATLFLAADAILIIVLCIWKEIQKHKRHKLLVAARMEMKAKMPSEGKPGESEDKSTLQESGAPNYDAANSGETESFDEYGIGSDGFESMSASAVITEKSSSEAKAGAEGNSDKKDSNVNASEIVDHLFDRGMPWGTNEKRQALMRRFICLVISFFMFSCFILMEVPKGTNLYSFLSQEFFSYHLRDIMGKEVGNSGSADDTSVMVVPLDYDKEKQGPDFGCAKDMNLIIIQVEAMENFVINRKYEGQEITPFLNDLIEEDTLYFNSYFQQTGSGNTSDAEFATLNSMFGYMEYYTYSIFEDNYWYGLPKILKDKGYSTAAYHAYVPEFWNRGRIYPKLGFDEFYSQEDFDVTEALGMGLSDRLFFAQSMEKMAEKKEPFFSFMVTLSSHYPFDIEGKLKLRKDDQDTLFGDYLESMSYVDFHLKSLFEDLKKRGLYDNTVVAIYGDHMGLNPKTDTSTERMSDLLERPYDFEDGINVPLLIHIPGLGKAETIETVGGHTDFLPTISYLMGFDSLDTIYFGHNLCTIKHNFVPSRTYVQPGSFVSGDVMFKMAKNGSFSEGEATNIRTHKKVPLDGLEYYYKRSLQVTNTSDYYLENDMLRRVLKDGKSLTEAIEDCKQESRNGQGSDKIRQKEEAEASKDSNDEKESQ